MMYIQGVPKKCYIAISISVLKVEIVVFINFLIWVKICGRGTKRFFDLGRMWVEFQLDLLSKTWPPDGAAEQM